MGVGLLIALPVTACKQDLLSDKCLPRKAEEKTSKNCIIFVEFRPISWHFNRMMEKSAFHFHESVLNRVFV